MKKILISEIWLGVIVHCQSINFTFDVFDLPGGLKLVGLVHFFNSCQCVSTKREKNAAFDHFDANNYASCVLGLPGGLELVELLRFGQQM